METPVPPPLPPDAKPVPQALPQRVLAGFWRRLLAFIIDMILLSVCANIVGMALFEPLARLGNPAHLIGLGVVVLYFGILNSSRGHGKTVGKRIMRIEVVDRQGRYISLPRSLARYAVLAAPFFLGDAFRSSALWTPWGKGLVIVLFSAGGAVIYLAIFNRRTRQSLHDWIFGTYVVRTSSAGEVHAQPIWKAHRYILAVWTLLVAVTFVFLVPRMSRLGAFPEVLAVHREILRSGRVHDASVQFGKTWHPGGSSTYLTVVAEWESRPESFERAATDIAAIVFENYPGVDQYDSLAIGIVYGYDIGIAHAWRSQSFGFPPAMWRERIERPAGN